jgi:hypothetical protein
MLKPVDGRKVGARVHGRRRHLQQDGFGSVLDHAKQNEVMVYAIGLQSTYFNGSGWCDRSPIDR